MHSMKSKIISLKVALAASFLFYAGAVAATISRSSIWHDESFTALLLRYSPGEIISRTALDVHPPLYYLVLKAWASIFGYTTVSLRLFSAICMGLAIILLIRLIQKMGLGRRSVVGASVAMVAAPYILRYAVEARMYAFGALLAVIATTCFLDVLASAKARRKLPVAKTIIYVLSSAGLFYTQYFLSFIVLAHFIYFLQSSYKEMGQFKEWIRKYSRIWVGFLAVGGLFLPWLPTAIHQVQEVQGAFWIAPVGATTFLDTIGHLLGLQPIYDYSPWESVVFVIGFLGISGLVISGFRRLKTPEKRYVLLASTLFVTCAVTLFLVSLPPLQPLYHNRYLTVPALFIYSALGICVLSAKAKYRTILVVIMLPLLGLSLQRVYSEGINFDRGHGYFSMNVIGQRLYDQVQPGDVVVSTSLWTYFDAAQYFEVDHPGKVGRVYLYQPAELNHKTGNRSLVYDKEDIMIRPDKLCAVAPLGSRVWLIDESGVSQLKDRPSTWQQVGDAFSLGYAKLQLFEVDSDSCTLIRN